MGAEQGEMDAEVELTLVRHGLATLIPELEATLARTGTRAGGLSRHEVLERELPMPDRLRAALKAGPAADCAGHEVLEGERLRAALPAVVLDGSVILRGAAEVQDLLPLLQGTEIFGHLLIRAAGGGGGDGATAQVVLPDELSVQGALVVVAQRRKQPVEVTLGATCLRVGGDIVAPRSATLPRRLLHVGGAIAVQVGTAAELPDDLRVGGMLTADGRRVVDEDEAEALVERLVATAAASGCGLALTRWDECLVALPELDGGCIRGDLSLRLCKGIATLPPGLVVEGRLELRGCPALASLPDNLDVRGDVDVHDVPSLTALPEGVKVGGDVNLSGSKSLTTLAAGLQVPGYLNLNRCMALTALPEGLVVGGNLGLLACSALTALPDRLMVGGYLNLGRATALAALPAGLKVGGDLYLVGCSAIRHLPEDLVCHGSLNLCTCSSLETLPEGLKTAGSLDLRGCKALRELPRGLRVTGSLNLSGSTALTALPDQLAVGGDLVVRDCRSLAALPGEGLEIGGGLRLDGCSALTALPAEVAAKLEGDLSLRGCSALTALPQGLAVPGDLDLAGCRSLHTLPEGLTVGGSCDLGSCASLTSLPDGLVVGQHLTLDGCEALRELPREGFTASGDLSLADCTALAALPESGLEVDGSLNLAGCSLLTRLPEEFWVGADLNLERCTALEALPRAMLAWPPRRDTNMPHQVRLGGSGLSEETLAWLREAEAPGLRFHVRLGGGAAERPRFASVAQACAFWAAEAQEEPVPEPEVADKGAELTLVRFLSRLRDAKEFGIAETRTALAKRVVAVLALLRNDEVGEEMLVRMEDSLDACGDKPVWALNQMHLVAEVAKARGSGDALRALGRRVMRLMVVHEHAKVKVDSLKWVDDVCVYLRFEIDLREALDLPVGAASMIFPAYITIEDEELEAAKQDALAITDEQFEAWLSEWPAWQRHVRHQVALELRWEDLPVAEHRQSFKQRASRKLSRMLSMTGDEVRDPVQLRGGGAVWSLEDVLRHWERTGLDLHNTAVSPDELQRELRRVPNAALK